MSQDVLGRVVRVTTSTDPEDKRPASHRVADALLSRIQAGEFRPGDPLPTYRSLAGEYEVAVNTALSAVRLLRDRGAVSIKANAGAQVRDSSEDVNLSAELMQTKEELTGLREDAQRLEASLSELEARMAALAERADDGSE